MAFESSDHPDDWRPANTWKYEADGLSAHTEDGSIQVYLADEAASVTGDDEFTPFRFIAEGEGFTAKIPVQRYWYRKYFDFNGQTNIYRYWRIVYDDCEITRVGETGSRFSELTRHDWLTFDYLLFNGIAAWPWPKNEGTFGQGVEISLTKTFWGGHLSRGWTREFVRNVGFFKSPVFCFSTHSPEPAAVSKSLRENRRKWQETRTQAGLGIFNTHNADELICKEEKSILLGSQSRRPLANFHIFSFAPAGKEHDLVPVGYSPDANLKVQWTIDEAVLSALRHGSPIVEAVQYGREAFHAVKPEGGAIRSGDIARWDWFLRFTEAALSWPHSPEYSQVLPPAAIKILRAKVPPGHFQPRTHAATIFPSLFDEFACFK